MIAATAPVWRKTSRSMANANCVEVAQVDPGVSWIKA